MDRRDGREMDKKVLELMNVVDLGIPCLKISGFNPVIVRMIYIGFWYRTRRRIWVSQL